MKTVKVKVELTITVDVDAYALAYGIDDPAQIRNDVKYHLLSAASPEGGTFASDSGIVDAELKNG